MTIHQNFMDVDGAEQRNHEAPPLIEGLAPPPPAQPTFQFGAPELVTVETQGPNRNDDFQPSLRFVNGWPVPSNPAQLIREQPRSSRLPAPRPQPLMQIRTQPPPQAPMRVCARAPRYAPPRYFDPRRNNYPTRYHPDVTNEGWVEPSPARRRQLRLQIVHQLYLLFGIHVSPHTLSWFVEEN